jgi:secreted trypsin-like serine protease
VGYVQSCGVPKSSAVATNEHKFFSDTSPAKIIGGQDLSQVNDSNFSIYSVAAIMDTSSLSGSTVCTGTFIAENIILTAAHCVSENAQDLLIKIGYSIYSEDASAHIQALKIIKHKDYVVGKNDLALIQVNSMNLLEKNIRIRPVRLVENFEIEFKNNLILLGYGTNQIETSEIDSDNDLQGAGSLRRVQVLPDAISLVMDSFVIDQSNGFGACHGDSGGPALINQNNEYFLVGVASGVQQGPNQADCVSTSVYTNVQSYKDWLNTSISMLK